VIRRALVLAVAAALAAAASASAARPWYLSAPDQFRLPPPPAAGSATTRAEVRELMRLRRAPSRAAERAIATWSAQPAVVPWTRLALDLIVKYRPRPAPAARALALLATGMQDALVAAHDSQLAYEGRSRPAPVGAGERSSYAPAGAAIAGAAETILPALFPNEPARTFERLASEATFWRLWAGLAYRSDVTRARALGRRVGALVLGRMQADGFTAAVPPPARPAGEAYWSPTPPLYEPPIGGPVGTWRPWLMQRPDELRRVLPGPSPYGSPEFMAEVRTVLQVRAKLTGEQRKSAYFWDDRPGTFTPPGHWFDIALGLVRSYRLDEARAAEALAYLGASEADSAIAFFEAKYHWWSIRPVTAIWRLCDEGAALCSEAEVGADPARAPYRDKWYPLIVTPSFPSYPSGHSTFSGAAARTLGHFFPAARRVLERLAAEAADSRLYAGIHFDEDNDDGLALGRAVGDLAIARQRSS
jgi:membrane-associated phospholipid phosphatase